jgi:hypothetical protein
MKKLVSFLLLVPTIAFSQNINSTESSGSSNIYNDAILRYINFIGKENKETYDTLYISKERSIIEDSLMTSIGSTYIRTIDSLELNTILISGKTIFLHFLSPLSFQNGTFSIGIVPLGAKRVREENMLVNSGSYKVSYLYDPKTKQFKFKKVDFYGF